MKRSALALLTVVVLLGWGRWAPAEVLVLVHGGRLEGELVNPDETPRKTYVIRLSAGGQISLEAAQVKDVIATRPEMAEYEKVRSKYPDTAEGQWALAEWCKEHRLEPQRKALLERVIQLDPEHKQARALLGYTKHSDAKWYTVEEWKRKQGYVPYKDGWKLPQEIELLEDRRKKDLAEKDWAAKIKQWHDWLGGSRNKLALDKLKAIEDPMAVKALATNLLKEKSADIRLLYIEILSKIHTPEAEATLAYTSMEDENDELRLTSLDYLQKSHSPQTIQYFVSKLRDKNNATINRAGVALGRLKDSSTIGPLIDALISAHKEVIHSGAGGPGAMSSTFGTNGTPGGGMGFGNSTKVIVHHLQNQAVLDALIAITGQNFSFDQRAWKTWYLTQMKSPAIDARRG